MKFTLSWLKEHLDTPESLQSIVDTLTMIGLEVENVEDKAKQLGAFVIAKVLEAKQHPNADRLRVCMVDIGDGNPIQVVCGAPGMPSCVRPTAERNTAAATAHHARDVLAVSRIRSARCR